MRNRTSNERGFGLVELIVVVALLGVLSVLAVPNLLSYYQSSSLTAGAEQLAAVMNRARHLAISRNTSVCVERTGTQVRLRLGSCVDATVVWGGPGTDSTGAIQIATDLQVGGAATAIFTNAGGASTPGIFSVTDPKTNRSRNVVVASTGRVSIQ